MQVDSESEVSKDAFNVLQAKVHGLQTRAETYAAEKAAWASKQASWSKERAAFQAKVDGLVAALGNAYKKAKAYETAAEASISAAPTRTLPSDVPGKSVFHVQSEHVSTSCVS